MAAALTRNYTMSRMSRKRSSSSSRTLPASRLHARPSPRINAVSPGFPFWLAQRRQKSRKRRYLIGQWIQSGMPIDTFPPRSYRERSRPRGTSFRTTRGSPPEQLKFQKWPSRHVLSLAQITPLLHSRLTSSVSAHPTTKSGRRQIECKAQPRESQCAGVAECVVVARRKKSRLEICSA